MTDGFNIFYKKDMRDETIKNGGLTLIEVLVAMGIFSIVISVSIGIFVNGSGSQRKILELNETQREANYLMETVSRELRMATAIGIDQENNANHSIEFTNYNGDLVKYCRYDSTTSSCAGSGEHFARDEEIINSADIKIENLMFYVTDDFDGVPAGDKKQPIVTIVMKAKSTGRYGTELVLQNSVAMRLY